MLAPPVRMLMYIFYSFGAPL
uniref:Uncharacterized protein n=1 Tax=Anguilla anguilla TaxID=7936 RepID=A0A0E9RSN8_ANGAN